ncbi:MAG: hypothetical protein N4A32_06725 [Marinifilaceae bacterium]|jgi:hypothetical protein|nr:hypothetical protein [Marinifilaceae bacterium]
MKESLDKKDKDIWLDSFEDHLNDYETKPSEDIWNKISSNLDAKAKKKKNYAILFRISSIAALFVIAFSLWIFNNDIQLKKSIYNSTELSLINNHENFINKEIVLFSEMSAPIPSLPKIRKVKMNSDKDINKDKMSSKKKNLAVVNKENAERINEKKELQFSDVKDNNNQSNIKRETSNKYEKKEDINKEKKALVKREKLNRYLENNDINNVHNRDEKSNKLSIGLFSDMNSLNNNKDNEGMSPRLMTGYNSAPPFLKDAKSIVEIQKEYNYEHSIPIALGVSIKYSLSEKLALESGINYTYLHSKLTEVYSAESFSQNLHYIGIPINISYSFNYNKAIAYYALLGSEIEKMIIAKKDNKTEYPNVWQLSFKAGIGTQIQIYKAISMFGELSVRYGIEDKSSWESYRTDNPLQMNIRLGIRWSR